jgi:hypothetical protein
MWLMAMNLTILTLLVLASAPRPVHGQVLPAPALRPISSNSPLLTTDRILQASLTRIARGSGLWREAIGNVGQTGRQVLVLTPADVRMVDRRNGQKRLAFDPGVLAEAVPIFIDESENISSVVVVVNLRLVQQIHDSRFSVLRDFEADLDRILVHEVYGHAVPYLLAGDISGQCADPKTDESPAAGCAIRRENAVRAELGLGRRADRGLYSLALAMRAR